MDEEIEILETVDLDPNPEHGANTEEEMDVYSEEESDDD